MAREIVLSNGMICLVDDCDYPYLSQFKWQATKSNIKRGVNGRPKWYAARWVTTGPPIDGKRQREKRYMHREIMNTRAHHVTDHRNGNGLDNRRENLRNCTQKTNCQNIQEEDPVAIAASVEWT